MYILVKELGLSPNEIREMTYPQVVCLAEGFNREVSEKNRAARRAKRRKK